MRCLKCKKEIEDNLLRCSYCNTKVQAVCPVCGNINPITTEYCARCGLQLLKYCPECHCVNFPDASNCRKCGAAFEKDEESISITDLETQPPQEETKVTQEKTETQIPAETETNSEQAETFSDEDFAMEEVEDNELIDFSDGENIDEAHNDADLLSLADNQETASHRS